ncbi:hypothetical protein ACTXT7_015619 [Hymenolepis weldensis]
MFSKQISEPTSCDISTLTGMTIGVVKAILDPIGVQYECTCYPASMSNDSLLSVKNRFVVLPQLRDRSDFINNFLHFAFSIMERSEITQGRTYLWLFFKALSAGSWVMIVFCSIVVALVLATLNYFSPNQVDYGFFESIFVTFGCLFQGLTVSPPNQWSSRFMLCVWWLFVLFFIVICITNYAAMIMHTAIQNEATGFAVNERNIKNEERVQHVHGEKYRLISSSFTLEYFATKYCLSVTREYSLQQYAIVLKLHTVYAEYLNCRFTTLINNGAIKTINYSCPLHRAITTQTL